MGAWKKVERALVERFDAALPRSIDVERRSMFGCPCAFVNGNMFAGLHETRLVVRVPEESAHRPFAVLGRTMREYAAIDDALDLPPARFRAWVERAYRHALSLPPKRKKRAAPRAGAAMRPRARSGARRKGTSA